MAFGESLDRYESALGGLLGQAQEHVITAPGSVEELQSDATSLYVRGMDNSLESLGRAAETYLSASEALAADIDAEFPIDDTSSGGASRLAALMGGHWIAATALTAAAAHNRDELETVTETIEQRRQTLMSTTPTAQLADALEGSPGAPEWVLLAYLNDHEVPDILLGLRGGAAVAGASADVDVRLSDTVSHVVNGYVAAANAVVANGAANGLGTGAAQLLGAATAFLHNTRLSSLVEQAGGAARFLRRSLIAILDHAVAIARRLIGDKATDQIEDWLKNKVLAFVAEVEERVARRLLDTDGLTAACGTHLAPLDERTRAARLEAMRPIPAEFDRWAGYGTKGAKMLSVGSLLGAAYLPVLGVVTVALVAYETWVAADHLDWPEWPLPNRARGVASVIRS